MLRKKKKSSFIWTGNLLWLEIHVADNCESETTVAFSEPSQGPEWFLCKQNFTWEFLSAHQFIMISCLEPYFGKASLINVVGLIYGSNLITYCARS